MKLDDLCIRSDWFESTKVTHSHPKMNTKWTHVIRKDLQIANWFLAETCVGAAQKNHLIERVLSSTKNICYPRPLENNASENDVSLSCLLHIFAGIID